MGSATANNRPPGNAFDGYAASARRAAVQATALANIGLLQVQAALQPNTLAGLAKKLAYVSQINFWRQFAGFQSGGYTGAGAANSPAGIVHKGEYVIPKDQVNQRTGLPYASALGQLMGGVQPTAKSAAGGRSTGGAVGTVDLSAHTIQQLARVVQTNIMLDGRIVGEAASNSYAANTRVGAA